jgi:hypothetical protein
VFVRSNGKLDIEDESGEEDEPEEISATSFISNITVIFQYKNKFAALRDQLKKAKEFIIGEHQAFKHINSIKEDSDSSSDEDTP